MKPVTTFRTYEHKRPRWTARFLYGLPKDARPSKVGEAWVEAPIDDRWMVAYRLVSQAGEPVVAELRVFPREPQQRPPGRWSAEILGVDAAAPTGGLPSDLLRQVTLGSYRERGGDFLGWLAEFRAGGASLRKSSKRSMATASTTAVSARGRSDDFYAHIAQDYVQHVNQGEARPVHAIAQNRSLPPEQVRDMIREARRRGLLTPTRRGRVGGQLTPRAAQLLGGSAGYSAIRPARKKRER
jgi:hypothetical protein